MFEPFAGLGPEPIGFLLIPEFSGLAFLSAVEPLRVANRLAGRPLFSWHAVSADGAPVTASNGMAMMVESSIDAMRSVSSLIVCASFNPQKAETKSLFGALRRLARLGVSLGSVDTGTHILAAAGLLDHHRVTMHWEAVPAFREEFPLIEVSDELFEIGRGRFTCAGGTASLDMMLHMIGVKHGRELAVAVSEQFIHDRIRDRSTHQRMQMANRLGITNQKLIRIIEAMENNLETPLEGTQLAELSGVSSRQLERLFRAHLKATPSSYYLKLRLARARQLLRQTDLSVMDVAMATGFSSASSLSRAYRTCYGASPRQDRVEPVPRAAHA